MHRNLFEVLWAAGSEAAEDPPVRDIDSCRNT
jgi:hypothetical protein